MREAISRTDEPVRRTQLATEAKIASTVSTHRGMGVGAACSFTISYDEEERYVAYSGTNINISGFQTKVHAEQLALHQAMMDLDMLDDEADVTMGEMVVVTDNDVADLVCGHCLQITRSACEFFGCGTEDVMYVAAEDLDGNMHDITFYEFPLDELLGKTYAES